MPEITIIYAYQYLLTNIKGVLLLIDISDIIFICFYTRNICKTYGRKCFSWEIGGINMAINNIKDTNIIGFYHEYDEYGYFSNWYHADFEYAGKRFSSVEQFMMYH